ncbi:extracellular salicylate hydroxylase/monooxygenase, variant 5 [Blastomyces dermatitidis ATCC 18188]|uniref:Extracellular salicylate hydroxylase/monooxygenase n=1 Tax=Ajellomyces dermatitidis (strain ATCC 18188 / CBS 674.68) TaxID=653446 RepID=F2T5Y3_AJEDA|nr:extracellular salicylate hydroxylase/monooxygenase [Blastomyces dermatitidis ATCC 18188]KMW66776.1 extracellular salicylate hydroxylase/monooxygenase, variant 1 [Blastomyces dermatitidis ATCC 18188]KMW66777.1 extracellular salicylate hydroxylase/monooxygenase, variant 2 [Blastomyces dermatitidis ATCC 18188]KMW66778.1 extracellular salicylate hydroxylase/monooxygenase, variant 3 [Blastomyces dermatitidis ATCC 18188]KMW66779.1 extracellular salicylate hydroxylase/monooxygenase, variant 4 [Blas
MKIAIIGAGIGGCAAYLSLKKRLPKPPSPSQDHEYTIYEAYATPRDFESPHPLGETHSASLVVGGGLGVGPNGLRVLQRLDEELFHDVVRAGYPYGTLKFMNSYGWTLMRMSTRGGSDPEINSVSMSRHAIWKTLRSRIPDGVLVNKRVTEVVANADGRNIIKFADGSPDVEVDLVIGADGLKSVAKKALFPAEGQDLYPPHYQGIVGIGGFVPLADISSHVEAGAMNIVFGGNGFFGYSPSDTDAEVPNRHIPQGVLPPGKTVMWWSSYAIDDCPNPETINKEAVKQDLQKRHGDWRNPVIQKIINSVEVETMYPVWTTPELPTWERNGVVLIGDAAHTLPPTSGQGTSQALEDVECFSMFLAYYLSQGYDLKSPTETEALAEKAAISQTSKKYMEIRQPRVKDILNKAKRMENKKRNLTIFEEWILYIVLFIVGCMPTLPWSKNLFAYDVAEDVNRVIQSEKQKKPEKGKK